MLYSNSHEWILVEKEIYVGTVGITEYARKELGEIVYIGLPRLGQVVKAREEIAVLESTKSAADVYSPVSGEIFEVNEKLRTDPSLLNHSAEDLGWLYKIKMQDLKELDFLLTRIDYEVKNGLS